MDHESQGGLTTVAGWTSRLPARSLRLRLHPPPRPFPYWAQLLADARNYKPWLFWIAGGGLFAFGVAVLHSHSLSRPPGLVQFSLALGTIGAGVRILLSWLKKLHAAVQWTRNAPLNVGTIQTLRPHPMYRDLAFADAVRADGKVVNVVIEAGGYARDLLDRYGECEVLYVERPWLWAMADTGFAFAARPVVADGQQATHPVVHWTGLNKTKRLELEQIALKVGYPIDAVFFVLSARSAVSGETHADQGHVAPSDLCQFIPTHAASTFGNLTEGARVLSVWGLCTGDDVRAIVVGCVEAGWLRFGPGESADDFQGIGPLIASSRNGPARRSQKRQEAPQPGRPLTTAGKVRYVALACFRSLCLGACLTVAVASGYLVWAERLTADERPLVGRWYAPMENNGEWVTLYEFGSDRSLRLQALRRGTLPVGAGGPAPLQWAARNGKIMVAAPWRGFRDRVARTFGLMANQPWVDFTPFRAPDANTLEVNLGDRPVVWRRAPAELASDAAPFPPRPAHGRAEEP